MVNLKNTNNNNKIQEILLTTVDGKILLHKTNSTDTKFYLFSKQDLNLEKNKLYFIKCLTHDGEETTKIIVID